MTPALSSPRESAPPESVLKQLRIPFVRRVALVSSARREDAFMIDIGLAGAFVERADSLPIDELLQACPEGRSHARRRGEGARRVAREAVVTETTSQFTE